MAKLSALQPVEIRKIAIDVNDIEVNVEVDVSAFTIGWQKRFQEASKASDVAAVAHEFFTIVRAWDVEDDKGKTLPLDATSIESLSMRTFIVMANEITGKLDPNDFTPRK